MYCDLYTFSSFEIRLLSSCVLEINLKTKEASFFQEEFCRLNQTDTDFVLIILKIKLLLFFKERSHEKVGGMLV
jgi:hypothetical protein